MKLRTEIERPDGCSPAIMELTYNDSIMLIGSCFSDNIGSRLESRFFDVLINPAGPLFNPVSIANTLESIADRCYPQSVADLDFSENTGMWCSFDFHGKFSSARPENVLEKAKRCIDKSHAFLSEATAVFITLGSNRVFVNRRNGRVVANCHRMPDSVFERKTLSVDECIDAMCRCVESVKRVTAGDCRIIFTISPVRHTAYTLHGNSLSKATLQLAVDNVIEIYPDVTDYFPAFEIMIDDLRDYRFYADDLKHPSSLAVEYIYEYLVSRYMNEDTRRLSNKLFSLSQRLNHRPLTDNESLIREFYNTTFAEARQLAALLPPGAANKVINKCNELFNN